MTTSTDQKIVFILSRRLDIRQMQVCAAKNATDAEILEVCNRENLAGPENGWVEVVRTGDLEKLPSQCVRYADRLHFIVVC